jgi:hypothetical protein
MTAVGRNLRPDDRSGAAACAPRAIPGGVVTSAAEEVSHAAGGEIVSVLDILAGIEQSKTPVFSCAAMDDRVLGVPRKWKSRAKGRPA